MMKRIHILGVVLLGVSIVWGSAASAGNVFITGHDPLWHSNNGGNHAGAANLALTGINYAINGSSLPFLFIESRTGLVAGNAYTAPYLTNANIGFSSGDYVHMDASDLNALSDFRSELDNYSAIWVASDHGGMLTAAELGFLNTHSADVIDFINSGGGLFAESESNATGLIGSETPFGFLPFLVSSTSFSEPESGNTVTAFGASLGLTNADVNGNFSHNYFSSTGGMSAVDLLDGNASFPLSLAASGTINEEGVIPAPAALPAGLVLLAVLALRRRRSFPS